MLLVPGGQTRCAAAADQVDLLHPPAGVPAYGTFPGRINAAHLSSLMLLRWSVCALHIATGRWCQLPRQDCLDV